MTDEREIAPRHQQVLMEQLQEFQAKREEAQEAWQHLNDLCKMLTDEGEEVSLERMVIVPEKEVDEDPGVGAPTLHEETE